MKQTISPGVFIGVIVAVLVVAVGVVFLRGGSGPAKQEASKAAQPPNVAAEIQKYSKTGSGKTAPTGNSLGNAPMPTMGGGNTAPGQGGMSIPGPGGAPMTLGGQAPGQSTQ
jgi:hypothetical protein